MNSALFSGLGLTDYPSSYVRFVYCLGYGEDEVLTKAIDKNSGTPQFWKNFYSCLNYIQKNEDFSPILKIGIPLSERIRNKIQLLHELKNSGIWLLDASLMALYGQENRLSSSKQDLIITTREKVDILFRDSADFLIRY